MSLYYCLSVRTGAALTLAWSILYSAANLAIAASHVVGLFRRRLFQKYSQKLSALKNIFPFRRFNTHHAWRVLNLKCLTQERDHHQPPPSLIHMVELGFVGLLNNLKRIFAIFIIHTVE